jgi:hypothetical protein
MLKRAACSMRWYVVQEGEKGQTMGLEGLQPSETTLPFGIELL